MLFTAIVFIFILSILVLIHEAGHYLVAKKFGIKVEEFGFGFPPRLWGKQKGETMYTINWLPIGGFVKLYGEDEAGGGKVTLHHGEVANKDIKRAFFARPVWQRALVVLAGVIMNVFLAIAVYYIFMFISGFKTEIPLYFGDYQFAFVHQINRSDLIITEVVKNSPAEYAGITPSSRILSVNGLTIDNTSEFQNIISANKGREITLEWEDLQTQKISKATLVPRINPPKNQGALGIAFFATNTAVLSYDTPAQKLLSGIVHPYNLMVYQFDILGKLTALSFKQRNAEPVSQGISGPVGIFKIVGQVAHIPDMKERILGLLNLIGLLSMSLAIFNVLPIPALDGGRLFFILIEGVVGRKINPRIEGYVHTVGFAVLLMLILLVTYKDIMQYFIK